MTIKIYCVNPQKVIEEKMKKAKSNIIFSATLIPMDYFMKMYSYDEEDFIINLKSPFDVKNRLLIIGDNVATTYNKRFETSEDIASYIANCVQAKKGNYMVFFPSYKYMDLVFDKMKENYPNINTSIQESNMSEEEKEEWYKHARKVADTRESERNARDNSWSGALKQADIIWRE